MWFSVPPGIAASDLLFARVVARKASPDAVLHLARRYGRIRQEIVRLKAVDRALEDTPDGQISLTDPD
ncbi:hypothetical protein D2T33_17875, partial [Sinirhodobacter populi]